MTPIQPTADQREAAENWVKHCIHLEGPCEGWQNNGPCTRAADLALLLSSREKEAYQRGKDAELNSH